MKNLLHLIGNFKKSTTAVLVVVVMFTFSNNINAQNAAISPGNIVACNTTIYDQGGSAGNYANNTNEWITIAGRPGVTITISGSYALETCCDKIYIRNGYGNAGTTLVTLSTGTSTTYTGTAGQTLTVHLTSDISNVASGFAFTVTYSVAPTCPTTYNLNGTATSVACGSNYIIKDHSGDNSSYGNNRNDFMVFNSVAGSTSVLNITGNYVTESGFDYLRVYQGVGIGGTLVYGPLSGTGAFNFVGTPGVDYTLQFTSDANSVDQGFSLNAYYSGDCTPPICTGTPAPGNTLASLVEVPSGGTTNLSLQNPTTGSGVSYQWQSGPTASGAWTNISGATSSTYTATVTANTYYRCIVTCSGNSGTSTPVLVSLGYCTPTSSNSSTYFSNFVTTGGVTNISNNSNAFATGGYFNYSGSSSASQYPSSVLGFTATIVGGTAGIAVYVDWNNDLDFLDAGEKVYTSNNYQSSATSSFTIPAGTTNGDYRMRIVTDYNSTNPSSCTFASGRGEIEDYKLTVIAPAFRAEILSATYGSSNWCAGETRTVALTIKNTGTSTWTDASPDINIGMKWNTNGTSWIDYHIRTDAGNLASGATRVYNLTISAKNATVGPNYSSNLSAGINNLTFDVVNENTCWFSGNSGSCGPGNSVFVTPNITISDYPSAVTLTPSTASVCANGSPVLFTAGGGVATASVNGASGTVNLAIPDNSATGVSNTLSISSIPANATISQVDVTFSLNHSWLQDAEVILRAPNGKRIALAADQGPSGTGSYTGVVISSNTSAAVLSTTSTPIAGTYRANATASGSLKGGTFSGTLTTLFSDLFTTTNGNWVIEAYDDSGIDVGTLVSWSINITYTVPNLIWSPTAGLFTDAAGTVSYSGGHASTLYALPASTQTYTVTSTSAAGCASSATATLTVNPVLNASVTVAASANPACLGNSVVFTATPTNGGAGPTYTWTKNGSPISGALSSTYSGVAGTDFVSTDAIRCILTSNATPCLAGSPATSSPVTMTVVNAAPTNTPGSYTSTVVNHTDGTTKVYNYDNCTSVGQITDASGGNVLGNTTMTSTVAASILSTNPDGYKYARRGYSVSPTSDGAMTLKMYFTQEDFNNYNSTAANFLSLPTSGNNSDPNIQFFRIATVVGGVHTISGPLGATGLTWNGTHWEFTMDVTTVAGAQYFVATMPSCAGVAVSNLAATNVTTDAVTATWTSVVTTPSWGWYSLRYRVIGAPGWTNGGTANNPATSRTIAGLAPGTDYEIQIRRHCSSQSEGAWSSSVLFTTLGGGCSAPMVFNAPSVTSNAITVTWPAVSAAAWYEFQYKEAASGTWISAGTLVGSYTSKTFSGLTASTSYNYRGRTYCTSGTASPWSITGTVSTTTVSGCSLPPVLTASTVTGTSATITWPSVSGAGWYEFRYKETSSGTWISAGTLASAATSKVLTSLTSATQYDFQARTYCSNGLPSAWSSTLQFTTTGLAACEMAPVLSVSNITSSSAKITWPVITGAGWYQFQYKETASGTWITAGTLTGTGSTKPLTGLVAGTSYDFQAKTYCNGSLASAWSSTLQFSTPLSIPMAPNPERVAATDRGLQNSNLEVIVYPNPTSDLLNIQTVFEKADALILMKVVDMNGRVVLEMNSISSVGMNTFQLSLSNLNVGIYNLELYNNNELIKHLKVIKVN